LLLLDEIVVGEAAEKLIRSRDRAAGAMLQSGRRRAEHPSSVSAMKNDIPTKLPLACARSRKVIGDPSPVPDD